VTTGLDKYQDTADTRPPPLTLTLRVSSCCSCSGLWSLFGMGCAASKGKGEPHHRNEQDTGIIRNVSHTHRNVSAAASGGGSGTPRGKIKIAMRKPLMESVEDLHCPICCRSLHASLSRSLCLPSTH
jgi:hypothetical protein